MVYGTVISNSIILGAIVSVSAMLSGSGPQARAVRLRPRLGRSQDLAVHPCFKDKEHTASSLVILLERLTRCSWASCCMLIVVRVVKRVRYCPLFIQKKNSAVYHPYFPLFITPCNELVIITKVITRCLVIITKVITRPRNDYEARNAWGCRRRHRAAFRRREPPFERYEPEAEGCLWA